MKYIKVEEQEFRTFIARMEKLFTVNDESTLYNNLLFYVHGQIKKYKQELEGMDSCSSKMFTQLKIEYEK